MLTRIGAKNFKIFKDEVVFDLKPITVLTGPNNSGKSTYNKLLYLLSQCFKVDVISNFHFDDTHRISSLDSIILKEEIQKKLGRFHDCLTNKSESEVLSFYFSFLTEFEDEVEVKLGYVERSPSKEKRRSIGSIADLCFIEIKVNGCEVFVRTKLDSKGNSKKENIDHNWKKLGHHEWCKFAVNFRSYLVSTRNKEEKKFGNDKINLVSWRGPYNETPITYIDNHELITLYGEENKEFWEELQLDHLFLGAFNLNARLLISSKMSSVVLRDNNFFELNFKADTYEDRLRKKLKKINITSKMNFINEYIKFEEQFIVNLFESVSGEKYSMEKFFTSSSAEDLSKEQIDHILTNTNSPLIDLFKEELQESRNDKIISYKKSSKRFLFDMRNSDDIQNLSFANLNHCAYLFWKYYIGLYDSFKLNLIRTLGTIRRFQVINQKITLRPTYFIEDSETDHDLEKIVLIGEMNSIARNRFLFVNKWLKEFKIGEKFKLKKIKEGKDVIGFSLFIEDFNGDKKRIDQFGLGSQKLISLLLKLSYFEMYGEGFYPYRSPKRKAIAKSNLIFIEEPEANLHPSLQSKLADLFVEALFLLQVRTVIETHSEYLIRKIQSLIAHKTLNLENDDVGVYYLYDPNEIPLGEPQVYKLDIRPDGFMNNDFGKGFFDEASSLSLGLLNLTNFN